MKTNTWTKPTTGTKESFDRGIFLNFKAENPALAGFRPLVKPEISFWDQVRCDASVLVTNSTGCVMKKHIHPRNTHLPDSDGLYPDVPLTRQTYAGFPADCDKDPTPRILSW
ncbi:hypothetical protein ABZV31_06490 [Streptomyces sp. NPDC005202]|uniref:hypothetical protein n=1 Tax=Streptomyces sp. NPDC005202 TaxID=3157021 RepID=UPI0033BF8C86